MNSVHFDFGLATPLEPNGGKSQRSLALVFQSVLQNFSQRLSGVERRPLADAAKSSAALWSDRRATPSSQADLPGKLLSTLDAAQNHTQSKTTLGSEEELDDAGMNLLQYVWARSQHKSTDPTEAWLLRNHAGYIVMMFAGYQPAGLSPKEIVDRYLEQMKGGNWPKG